jgi:hypothetical protein
MLKPLIVSLAAGLLALLGLSLLNVNAAVAFGAAMGVGACCSAWLIPGQATGRSRWVWALLNAVAIGAMLAFLYWWHDSHL